VVSVVQTDWRQVRWPLLPVVDREARAGKGVFEQLGLGGIRDALEAIA
jgi:hypothetical protein